MNYCQLLLPERQYCLASARVAKSYVLTLASRITLTGTVLACVVVAGCAARVRYYDAQHSDYHRFNRSEKYYYRRWAGEKMHQHQEYKDLDEEDQRAYWTWRHNQK